MTVKLAILKSGENIISDIKEGFYEDRLVCYILENPFLVKVTGLYSINGKEDQHSISLSKWPLLSKENTIEIVPEFIVTLVDPVDQLKDIYKNQVLGDIEHERSKIDLVSDESNNSESN